MSQPTAHRQQLDSLRFLAFAGVFLFHANEQRFAYGAMGVPLFFVLSGFLITRILVLNETPSLVDNLRTFYIRRTLRIFPLYYAVLLVLVLAGKLAASAGWYFFYLHNVYIFHNDAWTGSTNHFWSLCVEEQFYLLFPLLLLCTPKSWRTVLIIGGIVGSILTRVVLALRYPDAKSWALLPVAGEYIAWGCLIGLYDVARRARPLPARSLCVAGVVLAVAVGVAQFAFDFLDRTASLCVYQTLHAIAFALIVLGVWRLERGWLLRLLSVPFVVYLGKISYGLYVFHNFCYGVKEPLVEWLPLLQPVPGPLLALAATIGLAVLSWHLFESPINRLKEFFPYRKRAAAAVRPEGPVLSTQAEGLGFRVEMKVRP